MTVPFDPNEDVLAKSLVTPCANLKTFMCYDDVSNNRLPVDENSNLKVHDDCNLW